MLLGAILSNAFEIPTFYTLFADALMATKRRYETKQMKKGAIEIQIVTRDKPK